MKPTYARHEKCCTQEQKCNPDLAAQRRELAISRWVEPPGTVKDGAMPKQSDRGKGRHGCAKE